VNTIDAYHAFHIAEEHQVTLEEDGDAFTMVAINDACIIPVNLQIFLAAILQN
jgi:hypothetical protein